MSDEGFRIRVKCFVCLRCCSPSCRSGEIFKGEVCGSVYCFVCIAECVIRIYNGGKGIVCYLLYQVEFVELGFKNQGQVFCLSKLLLLMLPSGQFLQEEVLWSLQCALLNVLSNL